MFRFSLIKDNQINIIFSLALFSCKTQSLLIYFRGSILALMELGHQVNIFEGL
jgi:hypothetical protein